MALTSVGLQTHIWNNNFKSLAVLAIYPLMIIAMAWACLFVINSMSINGSYIVSAHDLSIAKTNHIIAAFWPFIIGGLSCWFLVAYFFHHRMIMKMSGAHSVARKDEPELYNLVENLCIGQGMTMPQLNIIETHGRNAFASGLNESTYAVTVSRGLMNSLKTDELEAVLAHELSHIRHRDVRLLVVTLVFTGMIALAFQAVSNYFRYNFGMMRRYRNNGKSQGSLILVAIAIFIVLGIGYLLTNFMRFFISRKREFMADAGAVEMTKNPEAMIRALMRISGRDQMPKANGDLAMMYIENSRRFMGMFATHPPIDKRIEALARVNNIPVPDIKSLGPVEKAKRLPANKRPPQGNPWLTRARRMSHEDD